MPRPTLLVVTFPCTFEARNIESYHILWSAIGRHFSNQFNLAKLERFDAKWNGH
jgi:hypothetical protein